MTPNHTALHDLTVAELTSHLRARKV